MEDDACHEAADADEEALVHAVAGIEHACEAQADPSDAAGETHEEPHLEDDVLLERPAPCAFVVFLHKVHHQRNAHHGNPQPQPETPELIPQDKGQELQEQE